MHQSEMKLSWHQSTAALELGLLCVLKADEPTYVLDTTWDIQLAAAFLAAGVVWGLPNGFGVFLATYLKDPSYASQPNAGSLLPLIGTLSSGIMYASGKSAYFSDILL